MKIYGYVDNKCSVEVKEGITNLSCKVYSDLDVLLEDIDNFNYGDILVLRHVGTVNKLLYKELLTKGVSLRTYKGKSTNLDNIKVLDDVLGVYVAEVYSGNTTYSLFKCSKELGFNYHNLYNYAERMLKYCNIDLYKQYIESKNIVETNSSKNKVGSTKDLVVNICNFCMNNAITFSELSNMAKLLDTINLGGSKVKLDKIDIEKQVRDMLYINTIKDYVDSKTDKSFYVYCRDVGVSGDAISKWVSRNLARIDKDLYRSYKEKVNKGKRTRYISEDIKLQIVNDYINGMNSLNSLCSKYGVGHTTISGYIHKDLKVKNFELYKRYIDVRNKKVNI